MKILIIGTARSGTTSLRRGIQSQGYHTIGEPFKSNTHESLVYEFITGDRTYPLPELSEHKNICIKILCDQVPKNLNTSFIEFIKEFIKEFDKVILLDRKNLIEHEESFIHLHWRMARNEKVHQSWTSDLIPETFKKQHYDEFRHTHLHLQKEQLKQISEYTKIPVTWYEDLYTEDRFESFEIINKWGLKDIDSFELNEYLHPKNKLKKSSKKSMI